MRLGSQFSAIDEDRVISMAKRILTPEEIKNLSTDEIIEAMNDLLAQLATRSDELARQVKETQSRPSGEAETPGFTINEAPDYDRSETGRTERAGDRTSRRA
jgi:hypothetical protein